MKPQRSFAVDPDRTAAIAAQTVRDAKTRKAAADERLALVCAQELAACVEQGLGWPEIRERLAKRGASFH